MSATNRYLSRLYVALLNDAETFELGDGLSRGNPAQKLARARMHGLENS
jgi:hypothetical protein